VEIGLPGALLYLALPVGLIVHGVRRLDRSWFTFRSSATDGGTGGGAAEAPRSLILSLIAGLLVIVVLDSASVTLRGSTMPI
jgi:hypothetical protein